MTLLVKRVLLKRESLPETKLLVVGYETKDTREIGLVDAETVQEVAKKLDLRPYLTFSFLPRDKFRQSLYLLEKGAKVTAFLITAA